MTARRTITVAAVVAAASLTIGGCGVTTDGAMRELDQGAGEKTSATNAAAKRRAASLPQPVAGEARIVGITAGSLTPLAVDAYRTAGGTTAVVQKRTTEAAGFAELCSGSADLVDSQRPITKEELARCREVGLTPVQFTVAADAVVLATKGGTDVGADCVPIGQVREIYRAGSPVYDWSQLGFADAPLEVGGPGADSEAFQFFGREVLGAADPSLTDVRSDYRVAVDDRANRLFVVGNDADAALAAQREQRSSRLAAQQERATKAAASLEAAVGELSAARKDQKKGIADGRNAADRAKAAARVRAAERAAAKARAYVASAQADLAAGKRATAAAAAATRRQTQLRGRVSYFRFSYYELYEEELRPLEISAQSGAGRDCVFPSQETVTDGSYPMSRQLLLTTTTAGLARSEVKGLLSAYLRRARELASDQRLVPVPASRIAEQQTWVAGTARPTIVVDPSAPR